MRTDKSVAEVLQDLKNELTDFVRTRVAMLVAEMREKAGAWKTALPLLVGGLVLALAAFGCITFALVALVAALVGGTFAWAIGGAATFALYLALGGVLGYLGYKEISTEGVTPTRTLNVLKQDQIWIQNETRAA